VTLNAFDLGVIRVLISKSFFGVNVVAHLGAEFGAVAPFPRLNATDSQDEEKHADERKRSHVAGCTVRGANQRNVS
jgi:hypothetical protein